MSVSLNRDLQATFHITSLLQKAKESTEVILDNLPDLFFVIDEEGTIYKCNLSVMQVTEQDDLQIVGHNIKSLFTKENWSTFSKRVYEVYHSRLKGYSVEFELEMNLRQNETRIILFNIKPLENITITHQRLFCVLGRDISKSVILSEKNALLSAQKNKIEAILNSSSQGFFTLNRSFEIEEGISARTRELVGEVVGKKVYDVFHLKAETITQLLTIIFSGKHLESLRRLAPFESQVGDRFFKVEFVPIQEGGAVVRVMGTVTDATAIRKLEKKTENLTQEGLTVLKVLLAPQIFADLIRGLEHPIPDTVTELESKIRVHTLKGEFYFFEFKEVVTLCEEYESTLKSQPYSAPFYMKTLEQIRLSVEKFVDKYKAILPLKEEQSSTSQISISISHLKQLILEQEQPQPPSAASPLAHRLRKLSEASVRQTLGWLNEVWLATASRLGKPVSPIEWKETVLIFSPPYQELFKTLVHSIRNSLDHGVEPIDERRASGKKDPAHLTIELHRRTPPSPEKSPVQTREQFLLILRDDGRGIQLDDVKSKALQMGLEPGPTEESLLDLLFQPGFSTAKSQTTLSGQGVGLCAIRAEAKKLGGDARILNCEPKGSGTELHVWFNQIGIEHYA